jgi:tight adherence protein B
MHRVLAVMLVAAAAAAAVRSSPRHLLVERLGLRSANDVALPAPVRLLGLGSIAPGFPARTLSGAAAAAGISIAVLTHARDGILFCLLLGLSAAVARLRGLSVRRASAAQRRLRVIETCDLLAAELRAGLPAGRTLMHASQAWPVLEPAAAASRLGGDVPAALRRLARVPGAESLTAVAAAWQIAERSGAGLAAVLDRIGEALRADEAVRREVTASLAPPRATARMLAVLPLFGLLLGVGLGGDPVAFLLGSTLGVGCLSLGAGLALGGLAWVEYLATAAER